MSPWSCCVISSKLPVVITVPDAFGIVTVLSAVGSVTVNVVSCASSVEPSNTKFPLSAPEVTCCLICVFTFECKLNACIFVSILESLRLLI